MKPLVLISGGAGFIGSHTADLLLKKGYKVRILDNLSPKTHNGKWPKYLDKRIEKIKGDVRNKKDWEKALKDVSNVIHLAAWMDLVPEFSKFFSINAVGTANLYEVIHANKLPIKKVVVASSQFVYGLGKWKCKKDGIVYPKERNDPDLQKGIWDPKCPKCEGAIVYLSNTEDHQDPPNQYAISKYTQELIAMRLGKLYSIPSTALRYSIVHGARQTIKNIYSGALRIFTLQLLLGKTPSIFEDGNQIRDFVSVKDVSRANLIVMESRKSDYEIYNVGGGKSYSVIDLALMIRKQLRIKKMEPTLLGEYRMGDIRHAYSDVGKLMKLGWKPRVSEQKSISDFINDLKLEDKGLGKDSIGKVLKKMYKMGVIKLHEKK